MYTYGKERKPNNTVSILDKYYKSLGEEIKYTQAQSAFNLFSSSLTVIGTDIFSNGKGLNQELSEASAKAEMFERLNNFAFVRINSLLLTDKSLSGIKCIIKNKNIEYISFRNLEKSIEDYLEIIHENKDSRLRELIVEYCEILFNETVPCIIFKNSNKRITIPICIVDLFYGTNGMSAGNNQEEASVQSLSEIIERNTILTEMTKKIKTKVMSEDSKLVKNNLKVIQELEKKLNGKIILIEYPRRYNIATYGVLFYKKNGDCFLKLGSHPINEIAVQRTLTEFMQGKSIENFSGLSNIAFSSMITKSDISKKFIDGSGAIPIKLFQSKEKNIDENDNDHQEQSNNEMITNINNKLNNDYDVFNVIFYNSDMCALQTIIPNFSEVIIDKEETLKNNIILKNIQQFLLRGKKESVTQIEYFTEKISSLRKANYSVKDIFFDSCSLMKKHLEKISLLDIEIFLLLEQKKYEEVLTLIRINFGNLPLEKKELYSCICLKIGTSFNSDLDIFDNNIISMVDKIFSTDVPIQLLNVNFCFKCSFRGTDSCLDLKRYKLANKVIKYSEYKDKNKYFHMTI